MATETIYKLQPNRTMHLRGFDRRGAAGALHSTSGSGFTVSGRFADPADFCVLTLWDADNFFEHYSIKYLPDYDFTGITLDFDLTATNLQWIESLKFPSIDWPFLDYVTSSGTAGTVRLSNYITSRTGRVNATKTYTVNGTAVIYDRVTLTFERYHWDYIVPGKQSITFSYFNSNGTGFNHSLTLGPNTYNYVQLAGDSSANIATAIAAAAAADPNVIVTPAAHQVVLTAKISTGAALTCTEPNFSGSDTLWIAVTPNDYIATALTAAVNATSWDVGAPLKLTAVASTNTIVLTANGSNYGAAADANMATVYEQHKTATCYLTPAGASKFTGAVDSTSVHLTIPFTGALASIRKAWLTFAPKLTDGAAYSTQDWSAVATNWTITDASSKRALKIAHPVKSVRVGSHDDWAKYGSSFPNHAWAEESGYYFGGFSKHTSQAGDKVEITYSCQHTHDLYLGTSLYTDRGKIDAVLDETVSMVSPLDCYLFEEPPVVTRRPLFTGVAAGRHKVVLTLRSDKNASSTGYNFYFDYLEAAVTDIVQDPVNVYTDRSPAIDYGTDHGYKLSPQRLVWALDRCGLRGDMNVYSSVFWWNQRKRKGGDIHSATVTFTNAPGKADGAYVLQFGGATQGDVMGTYLYKNAFPYDTNDEVAAHFAYYINSLLIGVWASATGNVLTITSRSPIYDFTFWAFTQVTGAQTVGTAVAAGDLRNGNEGIWEIDPTMTPVINKSATDWHTNLWTEVAAKGWNAVCAFSQELTSPPDNPPTAVWGQRYNSGAVVLTSTGFGTEGAGFISGVAGTTITMNGHGYITGNTVNINRSGAGATYLITVTGANTFTIGAMLGSYGSWSGPLVGDAVNRNLQTVHCAFSSVVSDYYKVAHKEMAGMMVAAGLTPWLQFGEVFHWFFSDRFSLAVTNATNASPISITCTAHGLTSGQSAIISGVQGNTGANGTWPIVVVDVNTFTLTGSVGNGTYTAGTGLATGGSMALYDADQAAAAATALGRPLTVFNHQDADPSVSAYADANFLRDRIKNYIDAIRTHVLATYAGAKFELLWAYDVCYKSAYWNNGYPYPQGGRLNRYINLPSQYSTKAGSGLDRIKMEALSWGASYRNIDLAKETMLFPYQVLTWSKADVRYLIPWFNGGCPWTREHEFTRREGITVNFWAYDQLCLLSWPLDLPSPDGNGRVL